LNSQEAISLLESTVVNARIGLPRDVFDFISRHTPMINVDLLVRDERGRTLLAWRIERNYTSGWHIPGGIVRYKETLEDRIMKVAETEIGAPVTFDPAPLAVSQIICPHVTRGHFISLLYRCHLSGSFVPDNEGRTEIDEGFLHWHETCPANIIKVHDMYRKYISEDCRTPWKFESYCQEHGS
jgi:colanic acid biosynthesis protein WcaH